MLEKKLNYLLIKYGDLKKAKTFINVLAFLLKIFEYIEIGSVRVVLGQTAST